MKSYDKLLLVYFRLNIEKEQKFERLIEWLSV